MFWGYDHWKATNPEDAILNPDDLIEKDINPEPCDGCPLQDDCEGCKAYDDWEKEEAELGRLQDFDVF